MHLLIIPRKHIPTMQHIEAGDAELIGHMHLVAQELAREYGVAEDGYRSVFNCGTQGGQMVWHIHLHLLGGRSMGWPPWPGN